MINLNEVKRLKDIVLRSKNDRLLEFVSQIEVQQLEDMLKQNLQLLFKEARKFNVRYLYVGKGEISGCEKKLQPDGTWPAMWAIAKSLGFPGSCGNYDQYQCQGSEYAFPEDSYGGWDLDKNVKLSDEEIDKMKFCRVVTRRY